MDRLQFIKPALGVICLLSTGSACEQSETAKPVTNRVIAIRAKPTPKESLAGFCDVAGKGRTKPTFSLPQLDKPYKISDGKSLWINLWATWCKPCIKEIPMLMKWRSQIVKEGLHFELQLISIDETPNALADFRHKNPKVPPSLRLVDADALKPWLTSLGLDQGAGLPIHIFLGPDQRVRCVRAGAVNDGHYNFIKKLLGPNSP